MKITGVLAGLLVLVMIGLTIYQSQLIKKADREAADEEAMAVDAVEDGAAGEDAEALKQQQIEFQKQMLADPAIRESVQAGLEVQYRPLFEVLALSSEKQEKLKTLLTNSVMDYLELNPEILAAVTDEEKQVLQQRYDYLRKETQLRVEGLLGHDAYLTYLAFEERTFSRTLVSGFSGVLAPGDGLTEDQEEALIGIIYGESQKVYADIGHDPTSRLDFPSDMDPETVSKKMEIVNRVLDASANSSRDLLSESQLAAFKNYLRTYSEEAEMSLIMLGRQGE
jgi:hypothetical protein